MISLVSLMFLALSNQVCGSMYQLKTSSIIDPLGGSGMSGTNNPPLTNALMSLTGQTFNNVVENYQLQYADSGYVTVVIKDRGSEKIVLSISRTVSCNATFDFDGGRIIFYGDDIDMEGAIGFENLLQVRKPSGLGYRITLFMVNERILRMTTVADVFCMISSY